jgi:quercetin dioxygenase-like cupin family protein
MGARYEDLQWQPIAPELGADSPLITILRVDPVTQATYLPIRVPKQIHVPMQWHSANETHTVIRGNWTFEHEGMRHQLGPGGFNYIPAKMRHQAWASDDALVFITIDSAWDVIGSVARQRRQTLTKRRTASEGTSKTDLAHVR